MTLLQRYCKRRVKGVFLYLETQKSRYMSTSPITRAKDKYKIKKWQAYNKSLCRRGSLTLWLEASVMKEWEHLSGKKKEVGDGQKSLNRTGLHDPLPPSKESSGGNTKAVGMGRKPGDSDRFDRLKSIWRRGMESS
jgi:hypothetical protein